MILQLQTNKSPLVSTLNTEEIQKRKEIMEGEEGMINKTKQRIKEKFTIEDMEIFGMNINEKKEFEEIKNQMIKNMNQTKREIVYIPQLKDFTIKKNDKGEEYYNETVSGYNFGN
jgi:hypothetical protein